MKTPAKACQIGGDGDKLLCYCGKLFNNFSVLYDSQFQDCWLSKAELSQHCVLMTEECMIRNEYQANIQYCSDQVVYCNNNIIAILLEIWWRSVLGQYYWPYSVG